jgi:adenylosuccinate synthase
MPYDICSEMPEPVYTEMKGWKVDLTKITDEADFPQELRDYIKFIEDKMRLPITIVSLGPDRKQTIVR